MTFERKKKQHLRHLRIRKKLSGTAERPRLCVKRSNRHFEAMLVNDDSGRTLLTVSTKAKSFQSKKKETKTRKAERLGTIIASAAKEIGITDVVFDRSGYCYHGRVKAMADKAREGGLCF